MWLTAGRLARCVFGAACAIMIAARGVAQQPAPDAGQRTFAWQQCSLQLELSYRGRIARVSLAVLPTEAQRAAFEALRAAALSAINIMRATCPTGETASLLDA